MLSTFNRGLSLFTCMSMGLVIFLANAKAVDEFPWMLLISSILMLLPSIYVIINKNHQLPARFTFLLTILPIVVMNYIFFITQGVPVGFTDTHTHIIQQSTTFSVDGKIQFLDIQSASLNFVGMYIVFEGLIQASQIQLPMLASMLPPFINVLTIVAVYCIARRLHSHNIGLLAMIFFGWDHNGLLFGQEMRTQTFGTFLLLIIVMIVIIQYPKGERQSTESTLAIVILLMGMVTLSFTIVLYSIIAFLVTIIAMRVLNGSTRLRISSTHLTWRIYTFFIVFFLAYLTYIGISFDSIMPAMWNLFGETFQKADANPSLQFYAPLYGSLIGFLSTILTIAFALLTIKYFIDWRRRKEPIHGLFIFCFGSLIVLFVMNNIAGPLSAARVYVVAFVLIAVAASACILKGFPGLRWNNISLIKIASILFILLFVVSAISMNPSYVIGETEPIRGIEPIDSVHYWNADNPQYELSSFVLGSIDNRTVHSFMLIENYRLQEVTRINHLINAQSAYIGHDEIVILHDKFYGKGYTNRQQLPNSTEFSNFNQIFTNGDYVAYET